MIRCGSTGKGPGGDRLNEEATTGFEPVIKVLQTSALPLGYVAGRLPNPLYALQILWRIAASPWKWGYCFKLRFPLIEVKTTGLVEGVETW